MNLSCHMISRKTASGIVCDFVAALALQQWHSHTTAPSLVNITNGTTKCSVNINTMSTINTW